jgi:two-component system sensor histidine kinase KdpD
LSVRDPLRPDPAAVLAELGYTPSLTVYLGAVPGAGKTHRLLQDARAERDAGRRVAIGTLETKNRPQLDALAEGLPRIPLRTFTDGGRPGFDLETAVHAGYETIVLDELAQENPVGAPNRKRWEDAVVLRRNGISVLGALNVLHVDTVAPVAERITGAPVREIVPLAFLRNADRVIALDVTPSIMASRLRSGAIVAGADVERAARGLYRPDNLEMLRELLLRTLNELSIPVVAPRATSTALAVITRDEDADRFLQRCAVLAEALDLALDVAVLGDVALEPLRRSVLAAGGGMIEVDATLRDGDLQSVRAALVMVGRGAFAERLLARPLDRDVFIADPSRESVPAAAPQQLAPNRPVDAAGDGALTIYLGSVAGSGKTYAMLDRAQVLLADGVDVLAALIETHGRAETAARAAGMPSIARTPQGELDLAAVLKRKPAVVLVDELAHTNASGAVNAKRFSDVIELLHAGIDVMTTLNVQHLEGLGDAVERLTGTRVRETLPDELLSFAREVVFIDVAPDVLRRRLRDGKIYPHDRIEAALANFFRSEHLAALRELTIRELLRARTPRRRERPFARLTLAVAPRPRDTALIGRVDRIARRLDVAARCVTFPEHGAHGDAVAVLRQSAAAHEMPLETLHGESAERAIAAAAGPGDVIVVESPRTRRRAWGRVSMAMRLVRAGVAELLVLAPQNSEAAAAPGD